MRICMLLHKTVEHDSRVRREARALSGAGHEVTVIHLPRTAGELDGQLDGFTVVSATPRRSLRQRLPMRLYRGAFLWNFVEAIRHAKPDAIHAHDTAMLVPGWIGARLTRSKLVYDTHEYAPGVPYRGRTWARFVSAVERTLIERCDAVITVSDGIAERLQERYRLSARPVVVRNVPDPNAYDRHFEAPDLRAELQLEEDEPLILHLGAVAKDRGAETLVRSVSELERGHLLFLGADDGAYLRHLRLLAAKEGVGELVHFRPSVPVAQVLGYTQQASVGVSLLEDTCENHRLALPNKVFEYMAANVPVVASDLPEMRHLRDRGTPLILAAARDPARVAGAIAAALNAPMTGHAVAWAGEARQLLAVYAHPADDRPPALVLVRNGVTHDARVLREAEALTRLGHAVTIVGALTERDRAPVERRASVTIERVAPAGRFTRIAERIRQRRAKSVQTASGVVAMPAPGGKSRSLRAARLRRLVATLEFNRQAILVGLRIRPTLIHCNDYNTMWAGLMIKLRTGAGLVYDSHELWADRNLRPEWRPWILACEAAFVRLADCVTTTSPGYADVLASRYRVPRPAVVRNVPDWGDGSDTDADADAEADADPESRTLVYFGAITENRGLEVVIRALQQADDMMLRVIGPDAWGYRERLRALAREGGVTDRVSFEQPVPPERAQQALAGAAAGLALIEPSCLSYRLTLPNKLYEYVHAGLPVLSSDVPVLAAAVHEHDVGICVDPRDTAAVANGMRELLAEDSQRRFRASAKRARTSLTWAAERGRLVEAYRGTARWST